MRMDVEMNEFHDLIIRKGSSYRQLFRECDREIVFEVEWKGEGRHR